MQNHTKSHATYKQFHTKDRTNNKAFFHTYMRMRWALFAITSTHTVHTQVGPPMDVLMGHYDSTALWCPARRYIHTYVRTYTVVVD